ncbi:MAG: lipopolysaccharide heptosyltransferase II [Myxococcota bacterium]
MTHSKPTPSPTRPQLAVHAERILVRMPTWVGDAVMATPCLRALRSAYRGAEITLEGRPVLEGLLSGLRSFDRFAIDPGRGAGALLRRARDLREQRFDLAVMLPDSPRSALGPFIARIPQRVGYTRDPLRHLLLTRRLQYVEQQRQRIPVPSVERYLEITRQLGCEDRGTELELAVSPESSKRVAALLTRHGVSQAQPLLVVTPGAAFGASKMWPTEHFADACDRISSELGLLPVLSPGPGEFETASRIAEQMTERSINLVDRDATLEDLKALIARSTLLLSNDTGPRHIAVALRRPCVIVMGPTHPIHTALHLEHQRVLRNPVACSPCQLKVCPIDHRCMTQLEPQRAVSAARELLQRD